MEITGQPLGNKWEPISQERYRQDFSVTLSIMLPILLHTERGIVLLNILEIILVFSAVATKTGMENPAAVIDHR